MQTSSTDLRQHVDHDHYVSHAHRVVLPVCQVVAQRSGPAAAVGISGSWPSSVSQYVQTTVRVTLNTSACGQLGQVRGRFILSDVGSRQSMLCGHSLQARLSWRGAAGCDPEQLHGMIQRDSSSCR